jgi:hypothetical protein
MITDPIDIGHEITALCDKLGILKTNVISILFEPIDVTVTRAALKDGEKYIDPATGNTAVEQLRFKVRT